MANLTALLSKVDELDKAATPKPWTPCLGSGNNECTALHYEGNQQYPFGLFVCDLIPDWALDDKYKADLEFKPANMDFIASSRALLPLMAKVIREYQTAFSALQKIAPIEDDVGGHYEDCDVADGFKCDCGVEEAWSAAREAQARVDQLCKEALDD